MNLAIIGVALFSMIALSAAIGYFSIDAIHWLRAWLYVRFFIRYEMPGCAVEATIREIEARWK